MKENKRIQCKIKYKYNEEVGEYFDDFGFLFKNEDGSINDYWWEEGNGACDCNRSIMFGIAEKYPEKCREGDTAFPCGDTIEILEINPIQE